MTNRQRSAEDQSVRKRELRTKLRMERLAMPLETWEAASAQIEAALAGMKEIKAARTVYSYIAFGREPETNGVILALASAGKTIVVPGPDHRVHAPEQLFDAVPDERTGAIMAGNESAIRPEDVDLFLVPGIVWDRRGHRIGFGGGFFDRLLARKRPDGIAIGLAFAFQVVPETPIEAWDLPVDMLVTQDEVIVCRRPTSRSA